MQGACVDDGGDFGVPVAFPDGWVSGGWGGVGCLCCSCWGLEGEGGKGGDVPFVHGTGNVFEVRSCQI